MTGWPAWPWLLFGRRLFCRTVRLSEVILNNRRKMLFCSQFPPIFVRKFIQRPTNQVYTDEAVWRSYPVQSVLLQQFSAALLHQPELTAVLNVLRTRVLLRAGSWFFQTEYVLRKSH